MPIDPIVTSVATSAAKDVIHKALGKTYEFILNKYKLNSIGKFKDNYLRYCEKLLEVKTIASHDRSVFIDEIYVPLNLKGVNTLSVEVNDHTNLEYDGRAVLIKGMAGMGKSTILRKLLSNNAKSRDRLPIFYELKHYKGGSIEDALAKNLSNVGVAISSEQIEVILNDSNVKLYLDAFDETAPQYRDSLLDEINKVISRYNCHLICTTRPDTELDSVVRIETFNVDSLSQEQIVGIIHRTSADTDKAKSLCDALERSPLHKGPESILKSPILVVLFCISYNLGEEIPNTLSQFYDNIFDTIFYRHDNLKGKVNRQRQWNDNRRIYKSLFEYLCFISQRSGESNFSNDRLIKFVEDSLSYMNQDKSLAEKVARELTSITNLIIEDGFNEYRFIHKSIQEFFSSSTIRTLPSNTKYAFYTRCMNDLKFHSLFSNTLFFLEELDYYDYSEHYLIPSVSDLLELNCQKLEENFSPSSSLVAKFLDSIIIRAKHIVVYDKRIKKSSVEQELFLPSLLDEEDMPYTYVKLFNMAPSFLNLEKHENKILSFIINQKEEVEAGSGIFQATLGRVANEINIPMNKVKEALLIGIGILYKDKYNKAVQSLKNRKKQVEGQGCLDF
jgi:hypothetical protein